LSKLQPGVKAGLGYGERSSGPREDGLRQSCQWCYSHTCGNLLSTSIATTFPLMYKRLKLQQKKAIATALELPTSAIGDDLAVATTGRLQ